MDDIVLEDDKYTDEDSVCVFVDGGDNDDVDEMIVVSVVGTFVVGSRELGGVPVVVGTLVVFLLHKLNPMA